MLGARYKLVSVGRVIEIINCFDGEASLKVLNDKGLARSKGEIFNKPYDELFKLYDRMSGQEIE